MKRTNDSGSRKSKRIAFSDLDNEARQIMAELTAKTPAPPAPKAAAKAAPPKSKRIYLSSLDSAPWRQNQPSDFSPVTNTSKMPPTKASSTIRKVPVPHVAKKTIPKAAPEPPMVFQTVIERSDELNQRLERKVKAASPPVDAKPTSVASATLRRLEAESKQEPSPETPKIKQETKDVVPTLPPAPLSPPLNIKRETQIPMPPPPVATKPDLPLSAPPIAIKVETREVKPPAKTGMAALFKPLQVKAEPVPTSVLERYTPKRVAEMIGNEKALEEVGKWLKAFKARTPGTPPAILITGPPGIGKTTVAHLILKEHNFRPVELNSSEERTRVAMVDKLIPLLCNDTSGFYGGRITGVVLDEIDGMTGDAGGIGAVVSMLKGEYDKFTNDQAKLTSHSSAPASKPSSTKLTQLKVKSVQTKPKAKPKGQKAAKAPPASLSPVICIANQAYSKKMTSLKNICKEIKFTAPTQLQQRQLIERVLSGEGYTFESGVSLYLARRINTADCRHILVELGELLRHRRADNKHISDAEIETMQVAFVNQDSQSPFAASIRLLRGGQDLEQSMLNFSVDPGKVSSMVVQNYPDFLPKPATQRRTPQQVAQAESQIADMMTDQADLYSDCDRHQSYSHHGQVAMAFGTSVHCDRPAVPGTIKQTSQSLAPLAWPDLAVSRAQQSYKRLPLKLRQSLRPEEMQLARFKLPDASYWSKGKESKAKVQGLLNWTDDYNMDFQAVQSMINLTEIKSLEERRNVVMGGKGKNGLQSLMKLPEDMTASELDTLIEQEQDDSDEDEVRMADEI